MSVSKAKLTPARVSFFSACRENTGSYMTDSGGAYGRQHQMPEITPKNTPEVIWEARQSATISTPHYLDAMYEIDRKLMAQCSRFANTKARRNSDWFEIGRTFCDEKLGLVEKGRDNVYNRENDFSQIFVYELWAKPDCTKDYIYPSGVEVVVVYLHTGCDARGGYGRPLICRVKKNTSYSIPVDCCAEYGIIAAKDKDGVEIECDDWASLDEKWQTRYSSYPYGALEGDVEVWHEETRTINTVEVTLKTGERVTVEARMPYLGE